MSLSVSVIIPAYNAGITIPKTLESVLAQTCPDWEAIVVDDGSTDNTVAIVQQYLQKDNRIRLLCQHNNGVSVARNKGIEAANFDWLLFLDSDDWISDITLERATSVLSSDKSLDAVHFGWCFVAPDGSIVGVKYAHPSTDMFPKFAGGCVFPIHACVVSKKLVTSVGCFDSSYRLCADWDLWQRISRAGACFTSVREVFSFYRMQQNSLSRNVEESFQTALRIIHQGYSYDPRVPNCTPKYLNGNIRDQLPAQQLYCTIWYAGLLIGQGRSATHLLDLLESDYKAHLDAQQVAEYIFEAVCYSCCQLASAWVELWPMHKEYIFDFLAALGKKAQSKALAKLSLASLEGLIIKSNMVSEPILIGRTYGIRIEATRCIEDIVMPSEVERLLCVIEIEGIKMGFFEVAVQNGIVSGKAIKEAIDVPTAWRILGKFFEKTIYKKILVKQEILVKKFGVKTIEEFHEKYGWTYFLQQLWGRPLWPLRRFYNAKYWELKKVEKVNSAEISAIEIVNELPAIIITNEQSKIQIMLGGVNMGSIILQEKHKRVRAQALRVELTKLYGLELCRICVQKAILGQPLTATKTLKQRLEEAISAKDISNLTNV